MLLLVGRKLLVDGKAPSGVKPLVPAWFAPRSSDWLPNAAMLLLALSPQVSPTVLVVLPNDCMPPLLLLTVAKALEVVAAALAPKSVAPNMLVEGTEKAAPAKAGALLGRAPKVGALLEGTPKAGTLLEGMPEAGAPKAGNPKEGKGEGTAVLAAGAAAGAAAGVV